ncbi:MAG: alpha-hydroxy-acid oxidizing protein [Actinobacteria bacterium]|nr:MAG: alpha-hydroxy-acid oxidizing protein [Actinomycetota bacterium]
MPDPARFVTVDDYEALAREVLPPASSEFVAGGAGDERTLAWNRRAFDRWALRPRFLRGVAAADPSTELFGCPLALPVLIAPWAYQRTAHPDGELATARAAARAGTVFCASTTAEAILEDIAAASTSPKWWQLYVFADRGFTAEMLRRVSSAGYTAVVWTIDLTAYGLRHRETRIGYQPPISLTTEELAYDPSISWDDLAWIREQAPGLPVLLKGILTAEDAELAVGAGADGIVVSNHGGRQLDTSPASLDVLPEVIDTVGGHIPVLLDGGVRRGTDIVKALALGASAVMIGRPAAWGLAAGGEEGVVDVLRILREELENAMTLCGCPTVADITRGHVSPAPVG